MLPANCVAVFLPRFMTPCGALSKSMPAGSLKGFVRANLHSLTHAVSTNTVPDFTVHIIIVKRNASICRVSAEVRNLIR